MLRSARDHLIIGQYVGNCDIGQGFQTVIQRAEVRLDRNLEQMVKARDDEIILLKIVNPVFCPHHPQQVEADAVRAGVIQRKDAFAITGDDARAVDAQGTGFLDQAELDRVPVKPRELVQRSEAQRTQATLAISDHIIGKHRIGEHRDMAEHVMEDVGLLQIIELFGPADEIACRKATVGKMIEKDIVGHQARHSNDLPARGVHQPGVEFAIVGNARTAELQNIDPAQEGARRAARQHCTLARKQPVPHRMLFGAEPVPVLRDRCSDEVIDIFAPGADINSTVPGASYKKLSGTSMAAPVVSGVAAILKSYFPQLSASQLKDVIVSSARQYEGLKVKLRRNPVKVLFSDLSKSGGVIDLINAFKRAGEVTGM